MARIGGKVNSKQDGQGITEYAVVLVAIVLLVVGTVQFMGRRVHRSFSSVVNSFQQQTPAGD